MTHAEDEAKRQALIDVLHATTPVKTAIESQLMDQTGFLLADNEALRCLAEADAPLRMTELAGKLAMSRGGITKLVNRLEEKDLARRSPDPSDGRSLLVEITEQGTATLNMIRPVVDSLIEDLWSRHLSADEANQLLRLAERVIDTNQDLLF
jgi:DNA-binding MarR family transcriptional regulator